MISIEADKDTKKYLEQCVMEMIAILKTQRRSAPHHIIEELGRNFELNIMMKSFAYVLVELVRMTKHPKPEVLFHELMLAAAATCKEYYQFVKELEAKGEI